MTGAVPLEICHGILKTSDFEKETAAHIAHWISAPLREVYASDRTAGPPVDDVGVPVVSF
jgi:hypothetical protein